MFSLNALSMGRGLIMIRRQVMVNGPPLRTLRMSHVGKGRGEKEKERTEEPIGGQKRMTTKQRLEEFREKRRAKMQKPTLPNLTPEETRQTQMKRRAFDRY